MKVSEYDSWIIQVGGVFLVGMPYEDTMMCRLSNSPYDAVPIEEQCVAERLARMAGGQAVKWNPVTGRVIR